MPDTIAQSVKVAQDGSRREHSLASLSIGLFLRFAEGQELTGLFTDRVRSDLKISTGGVSAGKTDGGLRSQSGEIIYDDRVMRLFLCNEKRLGEEGFADPRNVFIKYISPCVFFAFSLPSLLAIAPAVSSALLLSSALPGAL